MLNMVVYALIILVWALQIYSWILVARIVLDLVTALARSWYPKGIVLVFLNLIYKLTDPPLRFLNRYIRPLRIGEVSIDFSFIVLFFGIRIVEYFIALGIYNLATR